MTTRRCFSMLVAAASLCAALPAAAADGALRFGVGLFQPDREKNDVTYRPLASYLSKRLGRAVELRTSTPGKAWQSRSPMARPTSH